MTENGSTDTENSAGGAGDQDDSVTNLGSAPAMAMAQVYQSTANALATAALNAAQAQQAGNAILTATTAAGVKLIYGLTEDLLPALPKS